MMASERLRIHCGVPGLPVLTLGQVHKYRLVRQPLQVQRDADPERS